MLLVDTQSSFPLAEGGWGWGRGRRVVWGLRSHSAWLLALPNIHNLLLNTAVLQHATDQSQDSKLHCSNLNTDASKPDTTLGLA